MFSGGMKSSRESKVIGGVFIVSALVAILVIFLAQNVLHLAPCALCLWERKPWYALLVFGALTLCISSRCARWPALMGLLCVVVSLGLAVLHSGVEHGLWPSPAPECHVSAVGGADFQSWLNHMPARPLKPCDSPDYLFGLPFSITELGGFFAAIVFLLTAGRVVRMFRAVHREKVRH